MEFCSVARERPDYVDVSSGEGEGGLFVVLSFAAFPVVVGAGLGMGMGGRFGRVGAGGAGVVGEPVGGFERSEGAACEGDELRGKQGPEPGDAQQGFGVLVAM